MPMLPNLATPLTIPGCTNQLEITILVPFWVKTIDLPYAPGASKK